jgi:hypothetical protein
MTKGVLNLRQNRNKKRKETGFIDATSGEDRWMRSKPQRSNKGPKFSLHCPVPLSILCTLHPFTHSDRNLFTKYPSKKATRKLLLALYRLWLTPSPSRVKEQERLT